MFRLWRILKELLLLFGEARMGYWSVCAHVCILKWIPNFIYPLDEGWYVFIYSYTCDCVRHTAFNPQPIMTSLSQSFHWRHPLALLWSLLNYISSVERHLVVFSGSFWTVLWVSFVCWQGISFSGWYELLPCCKGAQTSREEVGCCVRPWLA